MKNDLPVYELGDYHVYAVRYGYDVYRAGTTHSTRCAQIGYKGETGLNKAKAECQRRINLDNNNNLSFDQSKINNL